jgi:predicted hotdog family 3-hydroxylacyl-ACP dehydratase
MNGAASISQWPTPGELMPHDPPLVLIDRVLDWDGVVGRCEVQVRDDFPLVENGEIPGHFCIELMAQGIACFAGLQARLRGENDRVPVGLVLGGREINFYRAAIPVGAYLMIEIKHVFGDEKLGNFHTKVMMDGDVIADGTINVYSSHDYAELP